MRSGRWIRGWVAGAAMLLMVSGLAACGDDASSVPATSAPAHMPAVGTRTPVYGNSNGCDMPDLSRRPDPGPWEIYVGHCYTTLEMSDPRVSGDEVMDIEVHWATGLDFDKWWTTNNVLSNDGGTWRGEAWGSEYIAENGDLLTSGYARYVGEGGYDGLVFHAFYAQSAPFVSPDDTDHDWSYWYAGWIEPAG